MFLLKMRNKEMVIVSAVCQPKLEKSTIPAVVTYLRVCTEKKAEADRLRLEAQKYYSNKMKAFVHEFASEFYDL